MMSLLLVFGIVFITVIALAVYFIGRHTSNINEKELMHRINNTINVLPRPINEYTIYTNEDTGYWVPTDLEKVLKTVKAFSRPFGEQLNIALVINEQKSIIYAPVFFGSKTPDLNRRRHANT